MPAGLDVTVPFPKSVLLLVTVSAKRFSMKVAVTVRAADIVTVHVVPDTESHPVHPVKFESARGAGVNATCESLTNKAVQAVPQVMPVGDDVTVPPPSPLRDVVSANSCFTVNVVLAVLPRLSVAVIAVVPAPTAVARPVALTVAAPGLLLVHVSPVP